MTTYKFSNWEAAKFFLPLSIQAMTQSLTYPLVGAIVSHGDGGSYEFSAFSQGLIVMFMLGTLGYGLVTTGMVFAKDKIGYIRFSYVNTLVMCIVAILQVLMSIPPFSTILFGMFLGLDTYQSDIARFSMLCTLPAQMGFFMRNLPQVICTNAHKTGIASFSTIMRILLTAALSPIFLCVGWTGWFFGCVALSLPVMIEFAVMSFWARPYVKKLEMKVRGTPKVTPMKLFLFNIPLSLGGFLLIVASFMLNAIINRTPDGKDMLAIHLYAMGLINPMSYGALRCQSVAIGFPAVNSRDFRTFFFSLAAGVVLAVVLLLPQIPLITNWYFGSVQNLDPRFFGHVRHAMLIATLIPILQAIRGHAEGIAAQQKKPNAILAGQAVFLATLLVVMGIQFLFHTPGYIMGVHALIWASLATFITIRLGLLLAKFGDVYEK